MKGSHQADARVRAGMHLGTTQVLIRQEPAGQRCTGGLGKELASCGELVEGRKPVGWGGPCVGQCQREVSRVD